MSDIDREKEIQEICKQVLETSPHYISTSSLNGKEHSCPFCLVDFYWNETMDEAKHDLNCAYIIAKGLSTNLII